MDFVQQGIIIIIKRISTVPICRTRWKHRALYNNTNNTHTCASDKGFGTAVKNGLEIIIKLVCLESVIPLATQH